MKKEVEKLLQYVQKPARYIGGELNAVVKDKDKIDIRYAFCFPDTYEIGMSHLGMKILYGLVNDREDSWCERVFAPDNDMEEQLRKNNVPLFALESGDYIKDFDMIGFTLQYELSYTNVLNMLNLAQIPLKSSDRENLTPLICVGGPCACNPEPITDFVDIVFLGDGEETTNQVIDLLIDCKKKGLSKKEFLLKAKDITGIYVPSFYEDSYNEDGTLKELKPLYGAPEKVKKAVVSDMNKVFYPKEFVVPYINIVHDRAVEEIFRGCIRGCRFCQAGFIYRPIREKSVETINKQSKALIDSAGYDELSLCSLSTSDHSEVNNMLTTLIDWTVKENINLSALCIAENADFGILRGIVSDPDRAYKALKENHFAVNVTDVVGISCPNVPGALAKVLRFLSDEGVFIEYMYSFANNNTANVVIRPNDMENCIRVLTEKKVDLLAASDLYRL